MDVSGAPGLVAADMMDYNTINYDRRILLTGGAGFIGSHVVDKLVLHPEKRYYVVNYDKLEYCSSEKNNALVECRANYAFIKGDILDKHKLLEVMRTENIDTVMHFAAQSHVDNSFLDSKPFYKTNVEGTQIMLEAACQHGVRLFLHVSTDEVYGGMSTVPLPETTELKPTNPYSQSKAVGEQVARYFGEKFSFPVIITRGNNVYGPRQYPEKVIPKFISLLQKGRKCCIHGDGSPTRNFMYVSDAAEAYMTVLENGIPGNTYNIGTDFSISIRELSVTILRKVLGNISQKEIFRYLDFVDDRPHNDKNYFIDSSKIRALGWEPVMPWERGLQITIKWYQDNFNNWANAETALVAFPTSESE